MALISPFPAIRRGLTRPSPIQDCRYYRLSFATAPERLNSLDRFRDEAKIPKSAVLPLELMGSKRFMIGRPPTGGASQSCSPRKMRAVRGD
jgi:hypothetical protein